MQVVGIAILALGIAATAYSPAHAQCAPLPGPLVASGMADKAYVDRLNALVARDPYMRRTHTDADWRVLVADLKRDPAASPSLLARSEMMLSQEEEGIAEELAAAREARRITEEAGLTDTPLHAEVLTALTFAEIDAGNAQAGAADIEAALVEVDRQFGVRSWAMGLAATAANSAYYALGQYGDAERFAAQAQALAIACLASEDPRIGRRIVSHGIALGNLGRLTEALVEDARGVAWMVAHLPENDTGFIYALDAYGSALLDAGRLREAEAVLRRTTDLIARHHPDNWLRRAAVVGKFGVVLDAEGHHREAEAMWLNASEYYLKNEDRKIPLLGAQQLARAASSAQERGDLPLALARRAQAVARIASRAQPAHPELARARIEQGITLALAGRGGEARTLADPAIQLLRAGLPATDFKRMNGEIDYAEIVAATSDAAAAYPIAAPVAQRMETILLDTATSHGDLIRFAPAFSGSFGATARFALAAHRDEDAFHTLQLANLSEIVLANTDIALRAAAANPAAHTLVEQLQQQTQTRQELDRQRVRVAADHDRSGLDRTTAAIEANDAAIVATTHELDRVYPAFRAIGRPTPITLADYRARLGPHDILIAPVALRGEALTIAVTREGLTWVVQPIMRSQTGELIRRIRGSVDAGRENPRMRFDIDAARQLYKILLPRALAPLLRTHRHIFYYAAGPLATIPPALLVASPARRDVAPDWLIRSHSISIVPALTTTATGGSNGRATFLGVGAPALGKALPTLAMRGSAVAFGDFGMASTAALPLLPNAARELREMAAMFGHGQTKLMLGTAATESAVKELPLGHYGVIAIATHALLSDALPGLTEPALVLTPPVTPTSADDGLLTASEVANLRLDADWVILSACDTASGSDPQTGSYSGLASAFMEAGARALLVSHWPVRDDAAEQLTVATVRAARGGTDRASALQHAMLRMIADRKMPGSRHPAIWAPFVLVER